jgi:hypothetical protein
MIISNQDILSDSQGPITASAASTNVIDIGAAGTPYGAGAAVNRDLGNLPTPIDLDVRITQVFNNLTSITIALQTDDNSAFASPKEVASRTYTLAEVNSLRRLSFPSHLPRGVDEQFFRLFYTIAGTAPTTGKIFAAIVPGDQSN